MLKILQEILQKIFYGPNYFAKHQSSSNEINFFAMVLISVYFIYSLNLQPLSFVLKKFSYQQLSSVKSLVPLTVQYLLSEILVPATFQKGTEQQHTLIWQKKISKKA